MYRWQVVFTGNKGKSFSPYDRLYTTKAEACEASRRLDGCGLRYGARVKRIHIKSEG